MNKWQDAQVWELRWWNNCTNTFGEELKQLFYADKMGLIATPDDKTPFRFTMQGKRILDIGGGPSSLLLKCVNVQGMVIDPLELPQWVIDRYKIAGIRFQKIKAEDLDEKETYDESWIYNILQHSENPEKIIQNAKRISKLIRIFEWIDTKANIGHPCSLTKDKLNHWLGGQGQIEQINGISNCYGKAYYGIFKGDKFEE